MDYLSQNNMAIGQRMRQVRRSAKMTQERLADTLGVTVNYLGEVERGRKPLSRALADQFCQHFNVTYDYLYHGLQVGSRNMIREESIYDSIHTLLLEQLKDCSPEEILVIAQLVDSYLDASRKLRRPNSQKNHSHRQNHTSPENRTPYLT